MNLQNLNRMLIGRLQELWGQRDDDRRIRRQWVSEDRGRRMEREDAQFAQQKNVFDSWNRASGKMLEGDRMALDMKRPEHLSSMKENQRSMFNPGSYQTNQNQQNTQSHPWGFMQSGDQHYGLYNNQVRPISQEKFDKYNSRTPF